MKLGIVQKLNLVIENQRKPNERNVQLEKGEIIVEV